MRQIRFEVVGRGAGTDAPTVDDLLGQVRDFFGILSEVEAAIADDGTSAIVWRITHASKASPLALVAEAFPQKYATNVDERVSQVVAHTAKGLAQLQAEGTRPPYFTNRALENAANLFKRVTNGLEQTGVDFGQGLPEVRLTHRVAEVASSHVRGILEPPPVRPYKEIGSIEGVADGFDRVRKGYPVLKVRDRLSGEHIECRLFGSALEEIERRQVGELWRGRVLVAGTVHFKGLGQVKRVDTTMVRFLRSRIELPSIEDIQDENFTGGLRSKDYLENLRDGGIS